MQAKMTAASGKINRQEKENYLSQKPHKDIECRKIYSRRVGTDSDERRAAASMLPNASGLLKAKLDQ